MTITEFLEARIAEDEAEAAYLLGREDDAENAYGKHFLAECAAKRVIVGLHRANPDLYGDDTCTMCTDSGPEAQSYPCATLNALAAVYKDHADYRQEWAL